LTATPRRPAPNRGSVHRAQKELAADIDGASVRANENRALFVWHKPARRKQTAWTPVASSFPADVDGTGAGSPRLEGKLQDSIIEVVSKSRPTRG
jgi:hypothetical protein